MNDKPKNASTKIRQFNEMEKVSEDRSNCLAANAAKDKSLSNVALISLLLVIRKLSTITCFVYNLALVNLGIKGIKWCLNYAGSCNSLKHNKENDFWLCDIKHYLPLM
jgi:hypothetical protein